MYLPVEPNLDDLYKETIDVKSSELVALKCRVAGDSYVIIDGKCGETLIMKPFLSLIYTPVVIEEVVDSNNGKCLYNKGDILYISEYYHITEQYNDRSLNFVQKAEENLKAKSLKAFCEKYQPSYAVRTSMSDYREQDWMTNIPLYAIKWIENYVNQ
jgi:hypothetical protein